MERVLSVLWAIIQAKKLGRAKLRLSRGWRAQGKELLTPEFRNVLEGSPKNRPNGER